MQGCFLRRTTFMKQLIERFDTQLGWNWMAAIRDWAIAEALKLQQIPAPTFQEEARAQYLKQRFAELNLMEIDIDAEQNVYGLLPGRHRQLPALMISAHTDTVFSADTDLTTRVEGSVIFGPGLGDNCMGVAGMLALAYVLVSQNLIPECDLWFVATSGEEGLGDLRGMRAAYARLCARIGMVINLEGLAFGHVYNAGIAVRRLHITVATKGGHSWLHFGQPSAIHGLVELGSRITRINPAANPRTTYNIGLINGGQSVNSIAAHAQMWLDMRSEAVHSLEALEQNVRDHIHALHQDDMQFKVEVVGDRPAGAVGADHPLVVGALAALEQVGVRGVLEAGSTDGNISLAAGCPTVTIGITRGGNAHRLDEFIEVEPVGAGLRQLILLALAAAMHQVR